MGATHISTMLFQAVIFLALTSSLAEPIRIDLKRMRSPLKHLIANAHNPRYKGLIKELENLKGSKNTVPLFKFLDYEFYGEVLVGHQPFNVVFDTTWADLWVPSVLCSYLNIACAFRHKYDSTHSPTYKFMNKSYVRDLGGNNKISGKLSMDTVNLGGLNITNQTFGEVESLPWKEFVFSKADGIFGLSFDTYVSDGIIPFIYNLVKQKRIDRQIFSFYMNRDPITEKGGSLLLGDIDTKHFSGNLSYVKVKSGTGFWEIPVDNIVVAQPKGKRKFCDGGCRAILDTSANEIKGPPEEIDTINGLLKARNFLFGRYVVDCGIISTLPHVTITIGNIPYVLKGKDIVQKMKYGPVSVCLSSFSRYVSDGPAKWIFGGAFLARYYSVYDMENSRVGFALANL